MKHCRDLSMEYCPQSQAVAGQKNRELLDADTGEVFFADQVVKCACDAKTFWKVYLMDVLAALGINLEGRQMDVLFYIAEHTKAADGTFVGTCRKVSAAVGVSMTTTNRVLSKLREHGLLTRVRNGVCQVSPLLIVRTGEHCKHLLLTYCDDRCNKPASESKPEEDPNQLRLFDC